MNAKPGAQALSHWYDDGDVEVPRLVTFAQDDRRKDALLWYKWCHAVVSPHAWRHLPVLHLTRQLEDFDRAEQGFGDQLHEVLLDKKDTPLVEVVRT